MEAIGKALANEFKLSMSEVVEILNRRHKILSPLKLA